MRDITDIYNMLAAIKVEMEATNEMKMLELVLKYGDDKVNAAMKRLEMI